MMMECIKCSRLAGDILSLHHQAENTFLQVGIKLTVSYRPI